MVFAKDFEILHGAGCEIYALKYINGSEAEFKKPEQNWRRVELNH